MASIILEKIAHRYPHRKKSRSGASLDMYALQPLSLRLEHGHTYALLGPSGCGKTTLLNIISGLLAPSEGKIFIDQQDVTSWPIKKRNIAQVFQFPVVYDTMTVFANLAFPLRNRHIPEDQTKARVHEIADILGLGPYLRETTKSLSADVKQKISLGRGIIRRDVGAILFDEPLTVVDQQLKWELRQQLKTIQQQYQLTFIYVTHDQNEALSFAQQVIVMEKGRVIQMASPQELFENPKEIFVGHFIGSPGMNYISFTVEQPLGQKKQARMAGQNLPLPQELMEKIPTDDLGSILTKLGIRPEFIELSLKPVAEAFPVQVTEVSQMGHFALIMGKIGKSDMVAKTRDSSIFSVQPGQTLWAFFPPPHIRVFVDGKWLPSTGPQE